MEPFNDAQLEPRRFKALKTYEKYVNSDETTPADIREIISVLFPLEKHVTRIQEFITYRHDELTPTELAQLLGILKHEATRQDCDTMLETNKILHSIMTHPNSDDDVKKKYRMLLAKEEGSFNLTSQAQYMISQGEMFTYFIEATKHAPSKAEALTTAAASLILNTRIDENIKQLINSSTHEARIRIDGNHTPNLFQIIPTKPLDIIIGAIEEGWKASTLDQSQLVAHISTMYGQEVFQDKYIKSFIPNDEISPLFKKQIFTEMLTDANKIHEQRKAEEITKHIQRKTEEIGRHIQLKPIR